MRAVVQRVAHARVRVAGDVVGDLPDGGLLILLAVAPNDGDAQVDWLARKLSGLRIFSDSDGKMNVGLVEAGLGALVVSQFTLYGNCRKGRRPSFVGAAAPEMAERLYLSFCDRLEACGVTPVSRGRFGADMKVSLLNDGPVTLVIDTP